MQPILNIEDVRRVEQALTREGVSISELMHRAGSAAAQEVIRMGDVARAAILVGTGNNGGDGWVAAEELAAAGVKVTVVSPIPPDKIKGDLAKVVAVRAISAGVPVVVGPPRSTLEELFSKADVVLDGMLGTGFRGSPTAPYDIWIDTLNMSGARVVAIDVPSGLSAQTGHAPGGCVFADVTVTMIALKPGLLSDEGRDACGSIVVAPLAEQTARLVLDEDPVAWRAELPDYLRVMAPPTSAVDKYSRGSVLVVAGSSRFPGAAVLAARAAARAGAGYVTLAVPETIVPVVQSHLVEVPVVGLPAEQGGTFSSEGLDELRGLAARNSAVLVGPGMQVTSSTVAVCSALLEADVPLVMDADALNCLARLTSNRLDNFPELIRRTSQLVLTPHRRELGRLMGLPENPPDSLTSALEASRRIVWADGGSELVIVAKGNATACVGVNTAILPKPGPASLATAGTGDVLAGIIAAQLARTRAEGDDLPLMCAYACEVHGYAGSIAAERYGSTGVMALDVANVVGIAVDVVEEHASAPFAGEDGQDA
ncbi:MAG: NAD(P)H-hydrate dehydratase [Atopobiaceae bacterium]|nr:NAD(P)H-hydrate dehydratase [Atopobiaceae bacterium]MBR3385633.1 NAD(P)H-hydrate dehydratase [Atopobiaceae bacterium]